MNHQSSTRALLAIRRRWLIVLALTITAMTAVDIANSGSASAAQNGTPTTPPGAQQGQLLEGRYIITFSGATNGRGRQDVIDALQLAGATIERNLERSLDAVVITFGGAPTQVQNGALNQLKRSGARVEQDQVVSTGTGAVTVPAATQTSAPWGLDRIDQTTGLNGTYIDAGTGSGVTVYVIDTGITSHDDFASRLSPGINMIDDRSETDAADGNGHGTHVAGTIAGTVHGVAKSAQLVPVRVLGDNGSGAISGVIAGIEWVLGNHTPGTPGIINMSLGVAGIPEADVAAISLNVTATGTESGPYGGYVTAHSCDGATPNASNLNFETGRTIANAVVVPVSAAGTICFDVFGSTHLIADVNGAFLNDSGFRPISPTRRADTRSNIGGVGTDTIGGDIPLRLQMTGTAGVPATGVRSVSMNLTVTETTAPDVGGYVTVYPCDVAKPNVSNLNFNSGDTVANAVTTPVSGTGEICVSVFGTAHVIIDVNGAITDEATFGAVNPVRVADSRRGSGPVGEINGAGGPLRVQIAGVGGVPDTGVAAVTLNLTVTDTAANAYGGYATVYPCDRSRPDASTVNFVGGDTVANAAIAPVSLSGDICVHVYGRASVIVDVNGWLAG